MTQHLKHNNKMRATDLASGKDDAHQLTRDERSRKAIHDILSRHHQSPVLSLRAIFRARKVGRA